jgi:hypothetical protein
LSRLKRAGIVDDILAGSFAIRQSKTILGRSYAHRSDGKGFVVRADEKLTAFLELESVIKKA